MKLQIILAMILVFLFVGMSLTLNVEVKKNVNLKSQIVELKRGLRYAVSEDSVTKTQLQSIQKDFLAYRDSFNLFKGGVKVVYKDRIITKKFLGKRDTLIVN